MCPGRCAFLIACVVVLFMVPMRLTCQSGELEFIKLFSGPRLPNLQRQFDDVPNTVRCK